MFCTGAWDLTKQGFETEKVVSLGCAVSGAGGKGRGFSASPRRNDKAFVGPEAVVATGMKW